MRAIILAGGLGTRLRSVVSDRPKPMALVQGRPFLECLLKYGARQGLTEVVLSIGYMAESIRSHFQSHFNDRFEGLRISYCIEDEPLGTGGAVRASADVLKSDGSVFILNGDTFAQVDYQDMVRTRERLGSDWLMSVRRYDQVDRYGVVDLRGDWIAGFRDSMPGGSGYINTGVYLTDVATLRNLPTGKFSLERDVFAKDTPARRIAAYPSTGPFIDIGVPEDYAAAQSLPFLR